MGTGRRSSIFTAMYRLVIAAVLGAAAIADAQPTTHPDRDPAPAAPAPAAPAPAPSAAPKPAPPAAPKPAPPAAPKPATSPATPGKPGAVAKPAGATLPAVGDTFAVDGNLGFPKLDWLYDVPSPSDAAGKVVVHWFCAPRVPACVDDLAHLIALKETGRVYIVAYINGSKPQAQKLDPIRDSEGVGRGTVAFGRGVAKVFKDLRVAGPMSIVVDVDGKVQLVATAASPEELSARDAKVSAATSAIREYVPSTDGPRTVKAGEKFHLTMTIQLASWLTYSDKAPTALDLTLPPDIKCDATRLRGDQIKIADRQLTASVTCSGPRGTYEARGELRFGYDAPGGGTGLGAESAGWKFEITP